MTSWTVVARYLDPDEAEMNASALRSHDIPVAVDRSFPHELVRGSAEGPGSRRIDPTLTLLVPRHDVHRATELLDEHALPLPEPYEDDEVTAWLADIESRDVEKRERDRRQHLFVFGFFLAVIVVALGSAAVPQILEMVRRFS